MEIETETNTEKDTKNGKHCKNTQKLPKEPKRPKEPKVLKESKKSKEKESKEPKKIDQRVLLMRNFLSPRMLSRVFEMDQQEEARDFQHDNGYVLIKILDDSELKPAIIEHLLNVFFNQGYKKEFSFRVFSEVADADYSLRTKATLTKYTSGLHTRRRQIKTGRC